MASRIEVSSAALRATASKITIVATDTDGHLKRLQALASGLATSWQGAARAQFDQTFSQNRTLLDQAARDLRIVGTGLAEAAAAYEQYELQAGNIVRQADGGGSPVPAGGGGPWPAPGPAPHPNPGPVPPPMPGPGEPAPAGTGSFISGHHGVDGLAYYTQLEGGSGKLNCGPASLAMAISAFDPNVTYEDVRDWVRRSDHDPSGGTNFQDSFFSEKAGQHGASMESLNGSRESIVNHLDNKHPVILLVDSEHYIRDENGRSVPYPNTDAFTKGQHIVVVTGYDVDSSGTITNFYINDPLGTNGSDGHRAGEHFRVPADAFDRAGSASNWMASAVKPR